MEEEGWSETAVVVGEGVGDIRGGEEWGVSKATRQTGSPDKIEKSSPILSFGKEAEPGALRTRDVEKV